jgi:hypothetical protein
MTSLLKLLGALELLKAIAIPVHQVKDLKGKLTKGTKQILNLTCQPGRGKG